MKCFQKPPVREIAIASLVILSFSCNQREETIEERKVDSVSIQAPKAEQGSFPWSDSMNSNNAVRVDLDSLKDFDWNTFRKKFHDSTDNEADFSDEVAVGPWVTWNEFQYRRVYSYVDDMLWIQTFYRSQDSADTADHEVTVLTSQDPNYVQFGPLWSDMLTRGHHLTDSLR